jgi:hypothetical protein
MLEDDRGHPESNNGYDTKIVQFHDEDAGMAYTYLLARINNSSGRHNLLNMEGYRSDHLVMVLLSGGSTRVGNDPYNPPLRGDLPREFLIEIRDGDVGWDQLDDDTIYTRQDLEELKDGKEQDSEKP